jgi:formylglycine-generating enzyme required for sulfatase activity/tRNA A-37 threonylcarbamoyl transferase component Bud32
MTIGSASDLIGSLRQHGLLESARLDELDHKFAGKNLDSHALAKNLIEQGWLTPYQVNQLLQGRGQDLALGQYVILERLGEGGMGQVFKARHKGLGRLVALKLVHKERLANPQAVTRFRREIQLAGKLTHPNIVLSYDSDQIGKVHFFTMEYVEGTDLSKLVKEQGPLPIDQACDFIRQAACGLAHAHEKGLVHRDIKPANLLLSKPGLSQATSLSAGTIKILDFGLARMQTDEDASALTQEGALLGTADFVAPEQAMSSHTADIRADLYSLGGTFYYLLTGRVPFPGGTAMEKLSNHAWNEPVPVEQLRNDVPAGVTAVVRKLMAKKPAARFQTPAELVAVLERGVGSVGLPRAGLRTKKRRLLVGGVLVGVLAIILAMLLRPSQPPAIVTNGIGIKFKFIPAGSFQMGSTQDEIDRLINLKLPWPPHEHFLAEGPQHSVELSQPFYLGVSTVTRGQFAQFVKDSGYKIPKGAFRMTAEAIWPPDPNADWANPGFDQTDDHPAVCISWTDAMAFIDWLNEKHPLAIPGRQREYWKYGLPTEAQWEYACRATTTRRFSCGDSDDSLQGHANLADVAFKRKFAGPSRPGWAVGWDDGYTFTAPVDKFKPNLWELYQMHGNVWQWCADWYDPGYYKSSPRIDPPGPVRGNERVTRGGAWGVPPALCRSAYRHHNHPDQRFACIGFRVACVRAGLGYELKPHPKNAVEFKGHWFAYYPEKIASWDEARKRCKDMGGYLACVRTAEEHKFILSMINGQSVWLGGFNNEKKKWYWITGEPIAHFWWAPGQPDNGASVFLQMGLSLPGSVGEQTWHDVGPNEQQRYPAGIVCEWDS